MLRRPMSTLHRSHREACTTSKAEMRRKKKEIDLQLCQGNTQTEESLANMRTVA